MVKKYLAIPIYSDLYQLINFYKKNSEVIKLCKTPEALQLPSLLLKNSLELNKFRSYRLHLLNTFVKKIEEAIVYVIEKALSEEIKNSDNWSIIINEINSITDEKYLAIIL